MTWLENSQDDDPPMRMTFPTYTVYSVFASNHKELECLSYSQRERDSCSAIFCWANKEKGEGITTGIKM